MGMLFKLNNLFAPRELDKLYTLLVEGKQVEIFPFKKIQLNNVERTQIYFGNKYGLRIFPHNNQYALSILLCIKGMGNKKKELYNRFLKNLRTTYQVIFNKYCLIVKTYIFENNYSILFYSKDAHAITLDANNVPDFNFIKISTYGGRDIHSIGNKTLKLGSDIKQIIRLIEIIINTIFFVYKVDGDMEISASCRIISIPSIGCDEPSKDINWKNEKDHIEREKPIAKSLRKRRVLKEPREIEKEKKYDDKYRIGIWERVKNTYVLDFPDISFDDIGGCDKAKNELMLIVKGLEDPIILKKYGVRLPKGLILFGPPGTGKTLLIKALANMVDASLFQVSVDDISSKWVGDTELMTSMLFALAKANVPSIILFDEIESICPDRSNVREWYQRVVSVILQKMDGFNNLDGVIVVGTTNFLENVDKALLRPGRFDKLIQILPPDKKGREKIFKIHSVNKMVKDIDYELLAESSKGLTGADIEATIQFALQEKMMNELFKNKKTEYVQTEDILVAINDFKNNRKIMKKTENSISYI